MHAYVVSYFESVRHLCGHAGVVKCHEDSVDDDTDGDEHVDERVGDKEFNNTSKHDPTPTALPAKHQVVTTSLQVLFACQRRRIV